MQPVPFEGQNVVIAKDQPQYLPLPAYVENTPEGMVHTCWELSDDDINMILQTRRLWLSQMAFGQPLQPIRPGVAKPF